MKGIYGLSNYAVHGIAPITLIPLSLHLITDYLVMFSSTVRKCLGVSSCHAEHLYLLDCLKRMEQKRTLFYCIIATSNNQLIGAIEIRHASYHTSQIYTWINEQFWGNGYFALAMDQAAYLYFLLTNFSYLVAHVDVINKRSYHAFTSYGFANWGFCMGPRGKQYCLVLRNPIK